eukprot:7681028-Lingulodinium_polyedra.AAC.1
MAPLADVQDASLAWHAESNDTAYMMDGPTQISEINRGMGPSSGDIKFTFENQKTWLSTIPALGKISDHLTKKPACAGEPNKPNKSSVGVDSSK